MTNDSHIAERRLKVIRAALSKFGIRNPCLRPDIKADLFNACCRLFHSYGIENLTTTVTDLAKMRRAEGNVVKSVIAVPKFARTTPVMDALRIEPIDKFAFRSKLLFLARLCRNPHTRAIVDQALHLADGKK